MVLLPSSTAYLEQSRLLITARPTTTRITIHYSLPRSKIRRSQSTAAPTNQSMTTSATQSATHPAAVLTLKTYDPVSGVVLQYRTNRAAEVGRLMGVLGRLGGVMAGRDDGGGVEEEDRGDGKEDVSGGVGSGGNTTNVGNTASTAGNASKKRKKGKK